MLIKCVFSCTVSVRIIRSSVKILISQILLNFTYSTNIYQFFTQNIGLILISILVLTSKMKIY